MSSNTQLPDTFWDEVNKDMKSEGHKSGSFDAVHHRGQPPRAWDNIIRLQIAHLFKSGIVGPGYFPEPSGFDLR